MIVDSRSFPKKNDNPNDDDSGSFRKNNDNTNDDDSRSVPNNNDDTNDDDDSSSFPNNIVSVSNEIISSNCDVMFVEICFAKQF